LVRRPPTCPRGSPSRPAYSWVRGRRRGLQCRDPGRAVYPCSCQGLAGSCLGNLAVDHSAPGQEHVDRMLECSFGPIKSAFDVQIRLPLGRNNRDAVAIGRQGIRTIGPCRATIAVKATSAPASRWVVNRSRSWRSVNPATELPSKSDSICRTTELVASGDMSGSTR
jgi:hypothetical protein